MKGVIYNVTGPNSRVNISSVDASTNILNVDVQQLFASMREALAASAIEATAREDLSRRISEMESARGSRSFARSYADFI